MSTPLLSFDTAHAAVLSMDLQTAIVSIYAKGDSGLITRAANVLKADVENKLGNLPDVKEVHVEIVFDPAWTPARMSEAAKLQLGFDL